MGAGTLLAAFIGAAMLPFLAWATYEAYKQFKESQEREKHGR